MTKTRKPGLNGHELAYAVDRMLQRQQASQLHAAAGKRGLSNLRVFGSATRDARRARDLDLLVDLGPDRTLLDLVAFRREAEALLSMPVDVATADMLKERIRAGVLAEAQPLLASVLFSGRSGRAEPPSTRQRALPTSTHHPYQPRRDRPAGSAMLRRKA